MMSAVDTLLAQGPVAVMDAECAICSHVARMIHRLDRGGTIRIAPMQRPPGAALMAGQGLRVTDPESWLLFEGGRVWRDFDAVIRLGRMTGGWGRALVLLSLIPHPLRDGMYRRLARNRYTIFGRGDMCAIPDPAFRARLVG